MAPDTSTDRFFVPLGRQEKERKKEEIRSSWASNFGKFWGQLLTSLEKDATKKPFLD